jgi:hypothetical protein
MIRTIVTAAIGERIASRYSRGGKGLLIGAIAPMVARRLFGPLGLALAGGYAAKKYYDHRKARRISGR